MGAATWSQEMPEKPESTEKKETPVDTGAEKKAADTTAADAAVADDKTGEDMNAGEEGKEN